MPAKRKNFDRAVRLYKKGDSIQSIAALYGVTRQAMWKILKRRGVKFRSQIRVGKENTFYRGGGRKSGNLVIKWALKTGRLKISKCEDCGLSPKIVNGFQRIQAHHDDYNYLLKVRWLCKKCHFKWHKQNKPIAARKKRRG